MFDTGAVIVAAGLRDSATIPAGKISVVQRIAAVFRKAGVNFIVAVTGPEDKLLEKQLSQSGVMFLRAKAGLSREEAARAGLEYLCGKCRRIFVMDHPRPLITPGTLKLMLHQNRELTVPMHGEEPGRPVLLSRKGIKKLLEGNAAELEVLQLPTEDEGVLLSTAGAEPEDERFKTHDTLITGVSLDLSINCGRPLMDRKLINLLYLTDETQSVREACNRIQISYSTAWNILNHAEAELGYALVRRNKGGASGSGSMLTDKGSKLLRSYMELDAELSRSAEKLYERFFAEI